MLALKGGKLIDGTGRDPIENALVIIEDKKIKAIGDNDTIDLPPECEVINVTGKSVLPGLMDLHVHFCLSDDDVLAPQALLPPFLDKPLPWLGIRAFSLARRALEMGFTTLRSCGEIGWIDVSLRDAIRTGIVEGPNIVASGQFLSTTGGHWDFFPEWLNRHDIESNLADGIDGVRKAVRRNLKMKTDWVKFCGTGGIMNAFQKTHNFTLEELKAMVEMAHSNGLYVAAHCIHHKGTLDAVKAGTDSIEHGTMLNIEIIDLMLENNTFLVPTLAAPYSVVHYGEKYGLPPAYVEKCKAILDAHCQSFEMALKAGIKIACGSDAGMTSVIHGNNALELELLVTYGMSPAQTIVAATLDSARCLHKEQELGSLEEGKQADIVVVDGDPLQDISILQQKDKIALVIKDGDIIKK